MKVAFVGDSHSTNAYGNSWAYHMKEDTNWETFDISCPGVGNEMFIEKIKIALENYSDIDFYIVQLTDPTRLVTGIQGNDVKDEYKNLLNNQWFENNLNCVRETNGVSYYTFKMNEEDGYLNKLLKKNYSIMEFIENHILISDFNTNIKIFHTLMALQNLFNFYDKKVLFFSWYVNIVELSKKIGYNRIVDNMSIINGSVMEYGGKVNLKYSDGDITHYDTESHKKLYEKFLKPEIIKFIEKNNI